ncbi:MAG: WbqC family protein [Acidobacteria bacterium]|nr:WbqC family protein [Acidobacteriota bacterium]
MMASDARSSLAAMQPYVFPYLGYFQLIHAVDTFVMLDDADFIVRGWINRNGLLLRGSRLRVTVPVKHPRRGREIRDVAVFNEARWKRKLSVTLDHAYHAAPFFSEVRPLVADVFDIADGTSIAELAARSIRAVCDFVGIGTTIIHSSGRYRNKELGPTERLVDICRQEGASKLINPEGGKDLYSIDTFRQHGIDLRFLHMRNIVYRQFRNHAFVPRLSIIDVLMFNGSDGTRKLLDQFDLR